jgi:hypothetical protein
MEKKYLAIVIICLGWLVSFPTAIYLHQIMNPPLVFAPMKTDQFNVVAVNFGGTANQSTNYINMTIQNIGSSSFTISSGAKVNGVWKPLIAQVTIQAGYSTIVRILNVGWEYGQQYRIELILTDGTKIIYGPVTP